MAGLRIVGVVALLVLPIAACSSSPAVTEPTTPNEAVQAIWDSFTQTQKDDACAYFREGRSTYGSSYIADRAEKKYSTFMNGDLYDAAYDMVEAKKYCD
jgi:hypothetical protein